MSLVVASVVDTSIVVGLGLIAVSLLRRRSAALRHWILAATVLCSAATPALEWLFPAWVLPVAPSVWTDSDAVIVIRPADSQAGVPANLRITVRFNAR